MGFGGKCGITGLFGDSGWNAIGVAGLWVKGAEWTGKAANGDSGFDPKADGIDPTFRGTDNNTKRRTIGVAIAADSVRRFW